ncbi:DUF4129 domain-containing protein [Streptomyces sp. B1866]|uniref:DUF4129 domain-containing protein n=1 Tax=Streptomyces sp. B1866 TaxID=3075431 RepID=UPI002890C3F8|nr:DUF4129 domain-containing protein [Streptomyces sp. B1866]MDT3399257.1 DUF4129 domain-containing protein [Streptomyces sp. B1866]
MAIPHGALTALVTPRSDGPTPLTDPRGPAREAARRELAKHMYRERRQNPVQRALSWAWRQVDGLFGAASSATPGGGVGLAAILVVVILLVVALRLRLGTPQLARPAPGTVFHHRPLSAAEHRSTAERLAAENHWDQAVQERMRALVRGLEERALLDPRPGRTADEAADEAARTLPGFAGRLRAAARAFDDVAYGGRPATAEEYARLRDLDLSLEQAEARLAAASPGAAG